MEQTISLSKQNGQPDASPTPVAPYTKLERGFGWLNSLVVALFLYTALASLILGLKLMPSGTWVLYFELVVDLLIFYALIHVTQDVGVNPHTIYWYPYALMVLRFIFPYINRVMKLPALKATVLRYMIPITMVIAIAGMAMVIYIRRLRKHKGMFTEQSEAAFMRDRRQNMTAVKTLNILMIVIMLAMIVSGIISDVGNEQLADYGALKFVTVLKYLLWGYTTYRLCMNLYHAVRAVEISRVVWRSYLLFMTVMCLNLVIKQAMFAPVHMMILWLLTIVIGNAAIFYVND